MKKASVDAKTWLRQQVDDPQSFYTIGEWSRMSGLPAHRLRRAFARKRLIAKNHDDILKGRGERPHHLVALDDVQRVWPALWRSVKKRISLLSEAEDVGPSV